MPASCSWPHSGCRHRKASCCHQPPIGCNLLNGLGEVQTDTAVVGSIAVGLHPGRASRANQCCGSRPMALLRLRCRRMPMRCRRCRRHPSQRRATAGRREWRQVHFAASALLASPLDVISQLQPPARRSSQPRHGHLRTQVRRAAGSTIHHISLPLRAHTCQTVASVMISHVVGSKFINEPLLALPITSCIVSAGSAAAVAAVHSACCCHRC